MADRPYNQYGPHLYSEDRWDQLCTWLTGNSQFRIQLAGHKQALRDHMGYSQEASDPSNKARRTVPPPGAGSSSAAGRPLQAGPKCLTSLSEAHKKRRGRPASCREEGKAAVRLWGAFEAEPKCLTLPSEAHKKRRGRPASCREEGKAAVRLWGAFEAEPKCLTLPSEAQKKRGGRLRTGHREAARGLPAAERVLKPVQNA